MLRRQFIAGLAGATAWPLAARAQQAERPVVGFLSSQPPEGSTERLRAYRQGLKETGHVEGENVTIEYRWAEHQLDRLPALAVDLVGRRVAVIATPDTASATVAKGATATIPIVFSVGSDPVALGLVTSLNRPGGNVTGINFFINELVGKRLELLRELVPSASRVAVLVNPANVILTEITTRETDAAARAMALEIRVLTASTNDEIHTAFERLSHERPDAFFVASDPFFNFRRVEISTLAARHGLPSSFSERGYVEAGGLMSYGTNINDAVRQLGVYTGRILRGERPANLPVVQSTRYELVINLPTAKALRIDVPSKLLATADAVIE
jgi:putative tryptophan/tyrosine transport system substrate-binding protein